MPYLHCTPGAVADAKALVRDLAAPLDQQTIEHTIEALAKRWASDESSEGD